MWPHGFDRSALSPDGRKMMLRCASWQCVGSWTWRQNRRRPGASTVNWYMSHNISIYISGNFRGGRSGLSFATQVQSANGASAPAINRAGCPCRSPPSWRQLRTNGGHWGLRQALQSFLEVSAHRVSGDVRFALRKGGFELAGLKAVSPLYIRDREQWEYRKAAAATSVTTSRFDGSSILTGQERGIGFGRRLDAGL